MQLVVEVKFAVKVEVDLFDELAFLR